jgi:hypothetical protein
VTAEESVRQTWSVRSGGSNASWYFSPGGTMQRGAGSASGVSAISAGGGGWRSAQEDFGQDDASPFHTGQTSLQHTGPQTSEEVGLQSLGAASGAAAAMAAAAAFEREQAMPPTPQ